MTKKLEVLDEEIAKLKDRSVSDASRELDKEGLQVLRELADVKGKLADLQEEN